MRLKNILVSILILYLGFIFAVERLPNPLTDEVYKALKKELVQPSLQKISRNERTGLPMKISRLLQTKKYAIKKLSEPITVFRIKWIYVV